MPVGVKRSVMVVRVERGVVGVRWDICFQRFSRVWLFFKVAISRKVSLKEGLRMSCGMRSVLLSCDELFSVKAKVPNEDLTN